MSITMPTITRMSALRGAGLSNAAVAAVIELDLGIPLTRAQVSYYLRRSGHRHERMAPSGVKGMTGGPRRRVAA